MNPLQPMIKLNARNSIPGIYGWINVLGFYLNKYSISDPNRFPLLLISMYKWSFKEPSVHY